MVAAIGVPCLGEKGGSKYWALRHLPDRGSDGGRARGAASMTDFLIPLPSQGSVWPLWEQEGVPESTDPRVSPEGLESLHLQQTGYWYPGQQHNPAPPPASPTNQIEVVTNQILFCKHWTWDKGSIASQTALVTHNLGRDNWARSWAKTIQNYKQAEFRGGDTTD